MYALWVCLLVVLKRYVSDEDLKYKTIDEFYTIYNYQFSNEDHSELDLLWQTANWMYVLFKMITARKNKGLAIQVIPKLIEGWDAKYVTGSGQKRSTANRVFLFESEGHTTASHRGKFRTVMNPKKASSGSESGVKIRKERVSSEKKRRHDEDSDEELIHAFTSRKRTAVSLDSEIINNNNNNSKSLKIKGTRSKTKAANESIADPEITDQDDDYSNEDMKNAYALMRTNTNTFLAAHTNNNNSDEANLAYVASLLPLGRDDTIGLGFDLTRSYSLNSVIPDFHRGYSWTETALTEAIVEVPDSNNITNHITNETNASSADENILSNDNLNDLFSGYAAK